MAIFKKLQLQILNFFFHIRQNAKNNVCSRNLPMEVILCENNIYICIHDGIRLFQIVFYDSHTRDFVRNAFEIFIKPTNLYFLTQVFWVLSKDGKIYTW